MDLTTARRKMVDSQIRPNDVTDEAVIHAFGTIPREAFLPKAKESLAYSEVELKTVDGRAFWLARDLSKLIQALEAKPTDLALVIAAGEGYTAALMNNIVDTVIALDSDADIAEEAGDKLSSLGFDKVAYVTGPLDIGYPSEGQYDVILVNGSVQQVSQNWLDQLKPGGRLGVVIGDANVGQARVYTATVNGTSFRNVFECVPPHLSELDVEPVFQF